MLFRSKMCQTLPGSLPSSPLFLGVEALNQALVLKSGSFSSRTISTFESRCYITSLSTPNNLGTQHYYPFVVWALTLATRSYNALYLISQKGTIALTFPVMLILRGGILEEGMATHSSILAWRIPWTEDAGGLQSMELQRVGYN